MQYDRGGRDADSCCFRVLGWKEHMIPYHLSKISPTHQRPRNTSSRRGAQSVVHTRVLALAIIGLSVKYMTKACSARRCVPICSSSKDRSARYRARESYHGDLAWLRGQSIAIWTIAFVAILGKTWKKLVPSSGSRYVSPTQIFN